jgi:predicted kinase
MAGLYQGALGRPVRVSPGSGRATLIMLVGLPGTGKSYLARLLAERLSAEVVQTDGLRKAMFRQPRYTAREHAAVYGEAHRRLKRQLRLGRTVIFDATNLQEKNRKIVYKIADEADRPLVIVRTYASPEAISQRLAGRLRGVDPLDRSDANWNVYRKLGRAGPVSRPYLLVNTLVPLQQAVELIAARVSRAAIDSRQNA